MDRSGCRRGKEVDIHVDSESEAFLLLSFGNFRSSLVDTHVAKRWYVWESKAREPREHQGTRPMTLVRSFEGNWK